MTLLSGTDVFPEIIALHPKIRRAALRSLCPVLQLHTIAPWNRAVGRVLDAGPSQLHAMYALYQLNRYRHAAGGKVDDNGRAMSLDELSAVLAEAICKMKTGHIEVVCMLILGVAESRVEELRSLFVCSQFVANSCDASVLPLGAGDAHFLLNALLLAVNRNDERADIDVAKSTRPVRATSVAARRVVSSTEESSASLSFDKEHCVRFITLLLQLAPAVYNLPVDLQQCAFSAAFGDSSRLEELLPSILTNEDIAPLVAKDIFTAIVVDHRELCGLLSGRAASPTSLNVPSYLMFVWQMKLQELVAIDVTSNLEVLFSYFASALRSLLSKASRMLNETEKKSFFGAVTLSLTQLTVHVTKSKGPQNGAARVGNNISVLNAVLSDEAAWLSGGILSAFPECFPLYSALLALTLGVPESAELETARQLLLARCLFAELTAAAAGTAHPWQKLHLVCSTATGVLLGAPASSVGTLTKVDLSDGAQVHQLIRSSLLFVASQAFSLQIDMLARIVSLYRLCTLSCALQDMPVAAHMLQSLLTSTQRSTSSSVTGKCRPEEALAMDVTIMEALLRAGSFDLLVEFLLLDMPARHGGLSIPDWRKDDRLVALVNQLPAKTAWRRQVIPSIIYYSLDFFVCLLKLPN